MVSTFSIDGFITRQSGYFSFTNDVPCSTTPNVPLKDIVRLEHNDISIVIVIQTAN